MAMSISGDNLSLNAVRFVPTANAAIPAANNAPSLAQDRLSLSGAAAANNQPASTPATNNATPTSARVNAVEASSASSDTYTVASGDTLSQIAQDHLGDANRWQDIYSLNQEQIADPNSIFPGQVLKLPTAGDTPAPSTAGSGAGANDARTRAQLLAMRAQLQQMERELDGLLGQPDAPLPFPRQPRFRGNDITQGDLRPMAANG